jgi:hypothetical protein
MGMSMNSYRGRSTRGGAEQVCQGRVAERRRAGSGWEAAHDAQPLTISPNRPAGQRTPLKVLSGLEAQELMDARGKPSPGRPVCWRVVRYVCSSRRPGRAVFAHDAAARGILRDLFRIRADLCLGMRASVALGACAWPPMFGTVLGRWPTVWPTSVPPTRGTGGP